MAEDVPVFGDVLSECIERTSVYAVILRQGGDVLVVDVRGEYHLPGGGVEAGEDEIEALKREVMEETGFHVTSLDYLGRAIQYLPKASIGPMKKDGTFYLCHVNEDVQVDRFEIDHVPVWVSVDIVLASTMKPFQKWAIQRAL